MSQSNLKNREMESRRQTDQGHIDEIPQIRRNGVRESLEIELRKEWPHVMEGFEDLYVTGSWARGEAIYGISDLDVVAVVDPWPGRGAVDGTQLHFKNEWSPGRFDNTRWLFVDLWFAAEPPEESVIL